MVLVGAVKCLSVHRGARSPVNVRITNTWLDGKRFKNKECFSYGAILTCMIVQYVGAVVLGSGDITVCVFYEETCFCSELPWDQPTESCQEFSDWLQKKTYLPPWKKIQPLPLSKFKT